MNFTMLRNLIHRRVQYRITRIGALFVLAVALTGAASFLTANNLLFLIFSAMLALLLVSGFLSRLALSGLELELFLPEHVSARTPTPARVRIRNLKRLTPSFSIELSAPILGAPIYFPLIPGRAVLEAPIQVTFPSRGRHRENLFAISTRFPFGFLRNSTIVPLRRETIVYPSLEPHAGDGDLLDLIAGEVDTGLRGAGLDFYRIRPYEITDSARLVDWKSTAHTGALQVREFSQEQQSVVEIYLDRHIRPGRNEWFETAVEHCAFMVWHMMDRGAEIWFRSQRFAFAIPDDGDVYGILRHLALTEPIVLLTRESEAQGPPDAAPKNGGTHPSSRDSAAMTCASSSEEAESPLDPSSAHIAFSDRPLDFERAGWMNITGPDILISSAHTAPSDRFE